MELDKNSPILIADDDSLIRDLIRSILTDHGFNNIRQAENGEQAVAIGQEFHPLFTLLDIYMPGMNGLEVARRLKKESPSTHVIMISVSRELADLEEAVDAGVDGYIFKPFEYDELLKEMVRCQSRALRGSPP